MQEALEAVGYRVALYDKNNFEAMGDANHFVQLTDRNRGVAASSEVLHISSRPGLTPYASLIKRLPKSKTLSNYGALSVRRVGGALF